MNYENLSMEELRTLRSKKLNEISRYGSIQMAKKIQLNSLYGAFA
jgi:hypothetical protein